MKIWVLARLVWLEIRRRKDFYLLAMTFALAMVSLLFTDTFGAEGAVRYITDAGLTLAWFSSLLLVISTAGRQLSQDHTSGVIHVLLSKPIARGQYLVGKWLGSWMSVVAATALFYLATWVFAAGRGSHVDIRTLVQAFVLHAAALGMVAALTLALGTRLTGAAARVLAWIIVLVSLFIVDRVPALLSHADPLSASALLILYFAFPQLTLLDLRLRLAHEWGPAPSGVVLVALAYGVGWTVLGLLLAWLGYRRRFFPRDIE